MTITTILKDLIIKPVSRARLDAWSFCLDTNIERRHACRSSLVNILIFVYSLSNKWGPLIINGDKWIPLRWLLVLNNWYMRGWSINTWHTWLLNQRWTSLRNQMSRWLIETSKACIYCIWLIILCILIHTGLLTLWLIHSLLLL